MSKRMKILFTISMVLNIVLIGVVAGSAYSMHHHWDRKFERKFGHFSPEVKARIKDAFSDSRDEFHAFLTQAKEAREEMKDILNADPFDEAAYDAATEQLNQARLGMMQLKADKTKDIVKSLSVEERRQMAGHLMRGGYRGMRGEWGEESERPSKRSFETAPDPDLTPMPE
jgi:uncharacterized membrane protein